MSVYEAIIEVRREDEPHRRAQDIADGIGYACALLADEYEWSADEIQGVLERVIDEAHDNETRGQP